MLSHDLFEGVFARAGLVTDIELFDEFPSNYLVSANRLHRWARGDWQLLPWILGRARDATGQRGRTSLPGIARWKMVDNLRRTMSAPFTVATFVAAWSLPSVSARLWTAFVVALAGRARGDARRFRIAATTAGHLQAQPLASGRRRHDRRRGPRGLRPVVPGAPGLADGRRQSPEHWCASTRHGATCSSG